jgi:alpha-methylacyl-CoA racemase
MILADMGADVLRIDRPGQALGPTGEGRAPLLLFRGQRSVGLDLKQDGALEVLLRLADVADVLIEGFRPGVAERLGIGPEVCHERNPGLVYGRMTGWGQDGPWRGAAGHDINYIGLSGALGLLAGRSGAPPTPPLNLLGDLGGGGLLLAFGIACALVERQRSGVGQVVDASVLDGSALLTTMVHGMIPAGEWGPPGTNLIDGGAPFYDLYTTSDGKYVSIGPIEERFYDELIAALRLHGDDLPPRGDKDGWPRLRQAFASAFATRTRDEWNDLLGGTDVCFAPVLHPDESWQHPHNAEHGTFTVVDGVRQPAPAPRFSRTPGAVRWGPPSAGAHTDEALHAWGFSAGEIAGLESRGVVGAWASEHQEQP